MTYLLNQTISRHCKRIKKTKVDNSPNYKYSGLFFCLVPK